MFSLDNEYFHYNNKKLTATRGINNQRYFLLCYCVFVIYITFQAFWKNEIHCSNVFKINVFEKLA